MITAPSGAVALLGGVVRTSTSLLLAAGGLVLFFQVAGLMTTEQDGDVEYGWAQAGALLGALIVAVALLKWWLWDSRNRRG